MSPLVHELCHVFDAAHSNQEHVWVSHSHPDYRVFADNASHTLDADLACVLCTMSVAGLHTFESPEEIQSASLNYVDEPPVGVTVYSSTFPARDPPEYALAFAKR